MSPYWSALRATICRTTSRSGTGSPMRTVRARCYSLRRALCAAAAHRATPENEFQTHVVTGTRVSTASAESGSKEGGPSAEGALGELLLVISIPDGQSAAPALYDRIARDLAEPLGVAQLMVCVVRRRRGPGGRRERRKGKDDGEESGSADHDVLQMAVGGRWAEEAK